MCVFFFKQKTAYEMRISYWSSDVCSSDLLVPLARSARWGQAPLFGIAKGIVDPLYPPVQPSGGKAPKAADKRHEQRSAGKEHQHHPAQQRTAIRRLARDDQLQVGSQPGRASEGGGALDRKSTRLNSSH